MTRAELFAYLDGLGIAHRTLEHPAVFRVGEGEDFKAVLPGGHTKNLFLKDAKDRLWLISALQDARIDLKRLPAAIGSARLSFGSAAALEAALGVTAGSVTALALVNDPDHRVGFVLDAALAEADPVTSTRSRTPRPPRCRKAASGSSSPASASSRSSSISPRSPDVKGSRGVAARGRWPHVGRKFETGEKGRCP